MGLHKNLILTILLALSCCQPTDRKSTDPDTTMKQSSDLETLRYLKEVEWPQAYKEQDTLLLDRILGDDFKMITADGEWSNKALQMERIKASAMDHDYFSYEIRRLEVLENGTAIIAGTGHIINNSVETNYESSNILIKREGIWKAVLSHVSGITQLEAMHEHGNGKLPTEGDFSYLLGSWERTNEVAGKKTFEHWKKINDELYVGLGYTMKESDTVWKEDVKLHRSENHWHYEVLGQGDTIATPFKITKVWENGFECFNPINEFPKTIRYAIERDTLFANISDGNAEIDFTFVNVM